MGARVIFSLQRHVASNEIHHEDRCKDDDERTDCQEAGRSEWHEVHSKLKLLASFVDIAAKEVKKTGLFSIQGLCRLKTRVKPATKAGVRNMFGKEVKVAAKPATTVVKAFPAAALKKQVI